MPRKRLPPDDPREWLNRARSNLACARTTMSEVYLEDLCFNAQQAAEKALKAVLRWATRQVEKALPMTRRRTRGSRRTR